MREYIMKLIREAVKPLMKEIYQEGYKDGERRILHAFRYGYQFGHSETMAALGEIDLEELDENLDPSVFEEVGA